MSEIKDVLKGLESEWREVKPLFDTYNQQLQKQEGVSAEVKANVEKADAKLDELEKKFNDLQTRQAMVQGTTEQNEEKAQEELKSILSKSVHGDTIGSMDSKSLSPDSGPDGGFAVMSQMRNGIISKIQEISPVRSVCEVVTLSDGEYKMLRENTDPSISTGSARGSVGETGAGDYDLVTVYAHEKYAFPFVARQQVEDQGFDLVSNLTNRLAKEFAQDEGSQVISGTGVNEAFGITTNSSISTFDSGSNTAFTFDNLIDLQSELKDEYNGTWGFNRKTRAYIRKLKGSDNYFWEGDMASGSPNALLGDPFVIMPDLVGSASGAYSQNDLPIVYGDWFEGYVIVDKLGLTIEIDRLTEKPFIGYYTRKRFGGDVKQADAFKILKITT